METVSEPAKQEGEEEEEEEEVGVGGEAGALDGVLDTVGEDTGADTGAVTGAKDTGLKAGDKDTLSAVQVTFTKGMPEDPTEHALGVQAPAATCSWTERNRVVQDESE